EHMEDGKILLSGHGSKEDSNSIYSKIEYEFNKRYKDKFYMATLEGSNTFDKVLSKLKRDDVKSITIKPLLIIPGKHYIHDISEGENSYVGILRSNGIITSISKSSLLQYKKIRQLYIDNIKMAIKN
ncbi:MAG: sirohydrochlorin cobaltochelatase, partial [Clostridium celatum]|nr:sirohydrochlorin cobaltochelatase [Clostridium celatum]